MNKNLFHDVLSLMLPTVRPLDDEIDVDIFVAELTGALQRAIDESTPMTEVTGWITPGFNNKYKGVNVTAKRLKKR